MERPVFISRAFWCFGLLIFLFGRCLLVAKSVKATLVINEFLPNPTGDDKSQEWVELKNVGEADVNVNNYRLEDAKGGSLIIDALYTDGGTLVSPGGWLVVYRNGHNDFSLNNSGDESISLYDSASESAELVDKVSYYGSNEAKTWGRIPDGSGEIQNGLEASKGEANKPVVEPSPSLKPVKSVLPSPTVKPSPSLTANIVVDEKDKIKVDESTSKPFSSAIVLSEVVDNDNEPDFGEILGIEDKETAKEMEENEATKSSGVTFTKRVWLSWILTGSGLLFILAAGVPMIRGKWFFDSGKMKKWSNFSSDGDQFSSGQD